jgi:DNA-binding IclR family transcriptional regulator
MATAVPAVDRAASILAYLKERQFDAHSLSDIAHGTGIHKATCAAILTALANHKLVSRDGDTLRYTLGPELIGLAQAYREQHRAFTIGRAEMYRLAIDVGLSCSATVVDGSDLVTVDIFGDTRPSHMPHRIGRIVPFTPPNGTVFKAWSSPEEVELWLDEAERQGGGDRDKLLAAVGAIRARGYSLGSEHDFHVELDRALKYLSEHGGEANRASVAAVVADRIRRFQDAGIDPNSDEAYYTFLLGPVFDHDGRVVMSVNLFGDPGDIRARDLKRLGPRLLETTDAITRMVGGVRPPDFAAQHGGL